MRQLDTFLLKELVMKNDDKNQVSCQCSMEIFGYKGSIDTNLNALVAHMDSGGSEILSREKWLDESMKLHKLIKNYLGLRELHQIQTAETATTDSLIAKLATGYCLNETYHNNVKNLFWINERPITFIRGEKIQDKNGYHLEIPIDCLSEEELDTFICVY
jgi:hypothetical protein